MRKVIPAFNIDGVLPPFLGADPGQDVGLMSPYEISAYDLVSNLGGSDRRQLILKDWLAHRSELRAAGLDRGFQWLDGSFLEDKEPNDLDLVTFMYRPPGMVNLNQWNTFLKGNLHLLDRSEIKKRFKLDAFFLDLNGNPEVLVSIGRYFLQLFSHQRNTFVWKGMVQVRMEDASDDAYALAYLSQPVLTGVQP